jgi:uncharacterized membrane protein
MAMLKTDQSHQTTDFLAKVLRIGVLTAASVIIAGGVAYLAKHGGEQTHYQHFAAPQGESNQIRTLFSEIEHGHSRSLIQLGLLLLIATPVARVVFSVLLFLRAGDRLYAVIAAIVLAVLTLSLAHA